MNGDEKGWIPVVLGLGLIALVLLIGAFGTDLTRAITIVTVAGATGGFVTVFFGDSELHWPRVENEEFQPGFLSMVLVGALATLVSWGAAKAITIFGSDVQAIRLSTGDIANALLVGFGGAKWFKSEMEKDVLQRPRRSRLRSRPTRMPTSPLRQELQIKRSERQCKCEHSVMIPCRTCVWSKHSCGVGAVFE
jgi:hypothetical protein